MAKQVKIQIFHSRVGGDQKRAKRRVNAGLLLIIMWLETQLRLDVNVALSAGCMMDNRLLTSSLSSLYKQALIRTYVAIVRIC